MTKRTERAPKFSSRERLAIVTRFVAGESAKAISTSLCKACGCPCPGCRQCQEGDVEYVLRKALKAKKGKKR